MRFMRLILITAVLQAAYCVVVMGAMAPWFWGIIAFGLIGKYARKVTRLSAHGTARWAESKDIPNGDGLLIGTLHTRPSLKLLPLFNPRVKSSVACDGVLSALRKSGKRLIRLRSVHTAVFAPTGVGKGVSCIIPHLLTCPDSCVVVDFKGENARITADARRAMGHKVVLLDPFKVVTQEPDTFNALDFIDGKSTLAIDEVRDLAEALVIRTGQEKEPHWADSAEVWISAMAATVVAFGEGADRSLQVVRSLLTNPAKMEASIKLMCNSDIWGGMLSRLGNQLLNYKDKELNSTLTTTNRFLRFLDTPAIFDNTRVSSFDPSELVKGKMTVYLILPPEHMRAQQALLRLWIGSLLRAVVKGGLQQERKVHFVLDEAASLGHMDALDDAVDKFRGYGVRLQFYYQSVGQLKKCWPDGQDQTLLSNTTQVFFGVSDHPTAEYVSNRLGESTIIVRSGGSGDGNSSQDSNQGASRGSSQNRSHNWNQLGRKLLKPEEVTAMHPRLAITFTPGVFPICTTLVRYYESGFGKQPGKFWAAARALGESLALLIATGIAAAVLTGALGGQGAADRPAPDEPWVFK